MRKEGKHAIICLDRLNVMKSNTALDPAFHGLRNPFTRFQFFIIGTKIDLWTLKVLGIPDSLRGIPDIQQANFPDP